MTRMVQLSNEAYRRLRMVKRSDESFSDTVLRLTRGVDLTGLKGLRTRERLAEAEAALAEADALDRL
jgi:predicted CopG family antitoxin